MDERWSQIRMLFREALDLAPAQWETFVQSRVEDEKIRDKVLSMLAAYDEDDTFLESPAANIGPGAPGRSTTSGLVGTRVGPYEIKRSIARGGMGVVFEALDTKLDKVVALKMMSPALVQDPTFRHRFEQEAKTLARLEDPHFVRVNALIDEGPNTFIVMEYVDGVTLAQHIHKRGPLAGKDAITVGVQLLQALSKAHRQGIVHRDLKPSNIMLTKNYEGRLLVKVLDFGIAKNILPDAQQTRTVGAVGTLLYMSPEQARGLRSIDHRTDLYSLGVTLYEAISRSLPFDVKVDEYTIRRQIVEGQVVPIQDRLPKVEPALARVLNKALSTKPDDRFEDADTMRQALIEASNEIRNATRTQLTPANGTIAEPSDAFASPTVAMPAEKRSTAKVFAGIAVFAALLIASFFIYNQFTGPSTDPANLALAGNTSDTTSFIDPARSLQNETPATSPETMLVSNDESASITSDETEIDDVPATPTEANNDGNTSDPPAVSDIEEPESVPINTAIENDASATNENPQDLPNNPEVAEDQAGEMETEPAILTGPTGDLSIRVDPFGSTYIDKVLMDDNHVNVKTLVAGMHKIRVENTEFGAWLCEKDVPAGIKTPVNVYFGQSTPVTVAAQDIGTGDYLTNQIIYIDGEATRFTTPETFEITSGLRNIELRLDNYELVSVDLANGAGCFEKVGMMINVDTISVQGRDRPLIELQLRKK